MKLSLQSHIVTYLSDYSYKKKHHIEKRRYCYYLLILRWNIRLNKHLAKLLQLFRASYFFCQEGKQDDMEKLVVELMCLIEVFLLHFVTNATVFAI